jgi:tyrosyl-tRNA synthetase
MKSDIKKLVRGVVQVIPEGEFNKRIEGGSPLTIKLGVDPTAPDLHLGHAVVLSKLKEFQDLGHKVVFLIGDFTARIGDPSGRSKTRPSLTEEEIRNNLQTYIEQVKRILDPTKITIKFNSQWLGKLSADDFVRLCSKMTVARILERDDFQKRLKENQPISLHELLYPLMQAYDSVALDADVELGGTDQTFNLLCGRTLQEQFGKRAQVVMTLPLLEGLDGVQKMSKSYNNYIGLTEKPSDVFGKLMSTSDDLMWRYYEILLSKTADEIKAMQDGHPKELKKQLAHGIVDKYWSEEDADEAQKSFEAVFEKKDYTQATEKPLPAESSLWVVNLLKYLGAIQSSSEAKRLIQSGAVQIDGKSITDFKAEVKPAKGMQIKVGKHRIYVLI